MENTLNEKYAKLIDEDEEFSINCKTLNRLVNPDNIKSDQSYEFLYSLGGITGLISKLNINPSEGINEDDIFLLTKRVEFFGSNNPVIPYSKKFINCFFEILSQKIFLFLIFAATVRLVIDLLENKGKWFDYSAIYIAVGIICLSMSIIEYSKEKVFENFQIEINNKLVRVLRNNEEKLIYKKDILVGDILIINAGEIIPIDGIIIKSYSITIDHEDTLMCYHSIDYTKHKINPLQCLKDEYPFILSGSYVIKGYAYVIVLCVGHETYMSKNTIQRNLILNSNSENKNEKNLFENEDNEKEYEIFGNNAEMNNKSLKYENTRRIKSNNSTHNYKNNPTENNNGMDYSKNSSDSKENYIDSDNNTLKNKNKNNFINKITKNSVNENSNKNYKKNNLNINVETENNLETEPNKIPRDSIRRVSRGTFKKQEISIDPARKTSLKDKTTNLTTQKNPKPIFIETADNKENNKNILDYEEEFTKLTHTVKNIEIRSGFFRNKSRTNFPNLENLEKKEIINVRSKDKRFTNSDIFYYSPLQSKIESIEQKLSKFGILASVISGLSYLITYIFISYPENFQFSQLIQILIDAVLYGLVIIVLAVPEGLPLASTLSAAFSINKMREENTIIKSIQACENLATINCICTDFNGVFTKNDMKVSNIFIENQVIDEKKLKYIRSEITADSFDFLCEAISINTIAYSARNYNGQLEYYGDAVETSLIKYLKQIQVNYSDFRNNKTRPIIECSSYSSEYNISYTIIEMDGKYDYVRLYIRGNPDEILDYLNNFITSKQTLELINPKFNEKIKKFCKDFTKEGNLPIIICYRDILRDHFNKLRNSYINKESEFLRGLLTQLTLICIICLKDEIKEDVKDYIEQCNKAGIIVKMVTSQDRETARIAAEKCGILNQSIPTTFQNPVQNLTENNEEEDKQEYSEFSEKNLNENSNLKISMKKKNDNYISFTNNYSEFDILDCQEDLKKLIDLKLKKRSLINNSFHSFEFYINDISKFEKIIQNSKVISKATAKDKYILISTLKKNGFVVAVTGDSVSDSLAMKSAQVSISMGLKATDMSKESADVILCDNSFKNILTGIIYGRNMYNSVRKFIQFQMTATISIITLALISALPLINFYFYPNQLLWLNLILDTLGSISLASEQPNKDEVLSKKPYSNKKNIITNTMKMRIFIQAIFQIFIIIFMVFFSPWLFGIESDRDLKHVDWEVTNGIHTTIVFTCLVYLQSFNALISRNLNSEKLNIFANLFEHRIFVVIQTMIIFLHYVIVTYGNRLTRSKALPVVYHLVCFGISAFVLFSIPIIRYFVRRKKNKIN